MFRDVLERLRGVVVEVRSRIFHAPQRRILKRFAKNALGGVGNWRRARGRSFSIAPGSGVDNDNASIRIRDDERVDRVADQIPF